MKVTEILDPEFKTGQTGRGKKWVLVKIEVEGGKQATGFGPVVEGDEVDLEYNAQYKNYSFKVLGPSDIPSRDINDDMQEEKPKATSAPHKSPGDRLAASSDERGDAITASMTTKLAYHGFIQTESMLPQDKKQWDAIQEQATKLYGVIQAVKSGEKAEGSGHAKAKATADKIRGVTEEFGDEEPFDE